MKTKYYVSVKTKLENYVSVDELESIFDESKYHDLGNGFEGIVIDDFKGKKVVMWKDDMYNRYLQELVDEDGEFEMDEEWTEIYEYWIQRLNEQNKWIPIVPGLFVWIMKWSVNMIKRKIVRYLSILLFM